eukprot:CAMPEP_0171740196 /NCGR_PEP_ID=MMETSP0991-20121206/34741_1 /TAXON_ID=483369 /ORGANISM="non described non described, Strain CCMP2098" /LENGTH=61 /DNA_ID=CAMNT_0012338071 /DNA_START=650 /DNA_END=832 /DNA_ORIENTATION=+
MAAAVRWRQLGGSSSVEAARWNQLGGGSSVEAAWQQYRIVIVEALRQQNCGSRTAAAERCT